MKMASTFCAGDVQSKTEGAEYTCVRCAEPRHRAYTCGRQQRSAAGGAVPRWEAQDQEDGAMDGAWRLTMSAVSIGSRFICKRKHDCSLRFDGSHLTQDAADNGATG